MLFGPPGMQFVSVCMCVAIPHRLPTLLARGPIRRSVRSSVPSVPSLPSFVRLRVQVRVETFGAKGLGITAGAYFLGVLIMIIVGATAPNVFGSTVNSDPLRCSTWSCNPTFYGFLNLLKPMHQVYVCGYCCWWRRWWCLWWW